MAGRSTAGCAKRSEPVPWCTGTRRAGGKMAVMYLWSFSTPKLPHRPGRGRTGRGGVGQRLLRAYNVYSRTWTHLLRVHRLNAISAGTWPGGPYRCGRYTTKPTPVPSRGCRIAAGPAGKATTPFGLFAGWYLGSDAPMRVLCQRVERFLPELFTFVAEPFLEAKPASSSRKISGGTRSGQGSETKSILASLFGTWRLEGRNPLL